MPAVVAVDNLCKRFGETRVLDSVTFEVSDRGVTGILGPNGAGKTTLLDLIEGLSTPTSGSIRLFGQPIDRYPRSRVGVMLQREPQLERCTTMEYAELFASIYGVRDRASQIVTRARLTHRGDVALSSLSGGEAARLFIATAMVHRPELLLLDEPTAHLDPASKREIASLLREIAQDCAVMLTTHDLREADVVCDALVFLVDGRVRAAGPRDQLVAAVEDKSRTGIGVEDAFFHFCAVRMRDGEAEREER